MTADIALLLARRFGTSAELWMNLQTAHDLAVARDEMAA
jgi:plasmid maintenance system antidote protein VapI